MLAEILDTKASVADAMAIVEIDELVPISFNGATLYYGVIRTEPLEPEWEVELE
jgi:hypothetical protein